MKTHTIVIYHGDCLDGSGAAYAAWLKLGDEGVEYLPYQYGRKPPEDLAGKEVYILDFSFPRNLLVEVVDRAHSVVLIDHHKTAIEDLQPLAAYEVYNHVSMDNLHLSLDINKSGCVLAWEYFHPTKPVPGILIYIQDRDLWRWVLKRTKPITMGLAFMEIDFRDYRNLREERLLEVGTILVEAEKSQLETLAKQKHEADLNQWHTLACNAPSFLASELGNKLALETGTFACVYSFDGASKQWKYSLRSVGDFDVSEIAKTFGGGGHRNAAGFSLHFNLFED